MDILQQILNDFGFAWPKFLAQLIIFTIVYLILSKYAFKPVVAMLEERRRRIDEAQKNAEEIKRQLAEAEARHAEILKAANAEAQRVIDEARSSGDTIVGRKQQEAIQQAEAIIAKAREATEIDRERMLADLKREVGRLVLLTASRVTGKVLDERDQRRLSEETARELAAR